MTSTISIPSRGDLSCLSSLYQKLHKQPGSGLTRFISLARCLSFSPAFCNQSTRIQFTSSTKSETATIGDLVSWPEPLSVPPPSNVVDVDVVPPGSPRSPKRD
ncbi:hypothetical protein FOCG_03493 [Fusarium oxysporum f. sp. radicis-lycopersici 26381]|uniref:Uncharacterized protein n=1 Tax=Fusarium oxysporum Fo47 TaxID=660027 RepID=W9KG47_FUSOX|nr:hypothetical protein FOZG_06364 [Fusarium oxysporum Fo47]EXA01973.1 hypothetical protein FOWG_01683 [Fusarium oxysporum f. sp. lycopersici MN25]EXL60662.1 hypothetical protein FOCG_03493 [Fusarium oxysporum f. sp. radicis-lycopersici 26381]